MGVSPCTLAGPAGPLFAVHFTPNNADQRPRDAVLYLPPFAEEMNRSRRMAALSARTLADAGLGVLILDLFGTGDSAGDFVDASWSTWCADAHAACLWLVGQGYRKISLIGLRLGAFLALETARADDLQDFLAQVVLWQPVTKGETFLNQFLRIRVAAGLGNSADTENESVKDLRARLADGATLEIAGYDITSPMAASITALDLGDLAGACRQPITWMELGSNAELSPASTKVIEQLSIGGANVTARILTGEPFWSIEEPALVPALWHETAAVLTDA